MDKSDQPGPSASSLAKKRKQTELVIVEYELNQLADKKLKKIKNKREAPQPVSNRVEKVQENDGIFVDNLDSSVGSHIKNTALSLYKDFKTIDTNTQSIVSLGLNSIIDLSFNYPEAQATLFTNYQWTMLRKKFPAKRYQIDEYDTVKEKLTPVMSSYKDFCSFRANWISMYRKIKSLQEQYDTEEDEENENEDFCLFLFETVLKLIKHHHYLFQDGFDKSEWDYTCKLWSPIMERLFTGSGLRLKWGDTKLSLNNIESKNDLKIDLRIISDETVQQLNQETDTASVEVSKGDPGLCKFQSDHCKLLVECKAIIDMYLSKGHNIDSVDCIQVCGLEIVILNLSLSAPGVYVATEIYHGTISDSLSNINTTLDIALNLLSFKNAAIQIKSNFIEQKSAVKDNNKSVKSSKYNKALSQTPLTATKKIWTRGTWIAFRNNDRAIPPPPSNLTA